MHVVASLFSAASVVMILVILDHSGLQRPKALMGCAIFGLICGITAYRERRLENRTSSPEFKTEKKRVTQLLQPEADVDSAIASLGIAYRIRADQPGISRKHGSCRIVDLDGQIADIRLEVRQTKIKGVKITAKY
jgi:hypothetical protein